ncbi:hypothetical protein RHOSPDRAFT_34993 [Rhodotorula sp. JG-1b]|nr:hypothetical protein RHOSPDRAFT_34993 [Rhodotorula sp. JG-1b]
MSKNTDLDLRILSEDYKAPISLEKLDQLSSVQLAIAAGTSEVDTLTRQRAYHSFATRKKEYERRGPTGQKDTLLEVPVDVPVPSSLDRCSPTQLLLYRFNPKCNSNDLVQLATSKLFAKVKAHQDQLALAHANSASSEGPKRAAPVPQDDVATAPAAKRPKANENNDPIMIGINSCEAYGLPVGEGEVDTGAGEPKLILSESTVQIVDCEGKEVCEIPVSLINEIEYEFKSEASIGRRACILKICAANPTEPSDDGLDTERTLPSVEI